MSEHNMSFYKEHPKTCARDDFWGQVRRTINGKPVPQEQIDMIVKSISGLLALKTDDFFLDLCCGNGALSTYFFSQCAGGKGVDFSDFLIDVAQEYFVKRQDEIYELGDVTVFVQKEQKPEVYTKGLCYGSFQFLSNEKAEILLADLHRRFLNLELFVLGNMPDRDRLHAFFRPDRYTPGIEDNPESAIGIWRSAGQLNEMAARAGWSISFHRMPEGYHASHYRFDAVLSRS